MRYEDFLERKLVTHKPSGFGVDLDELNPHLMDWQKVIVRWAIYKGRAAIFSDTGTGKTLMQMAWADSVCKHTGQNIIMFAPLAVSHQTVREGEKFGIKVKRCDDQEDVEPGINITNYERLDKFDPAYFAGIVLDESGIIKDSTAKFRNAVIEAYMNTPYKLCCSATPSPNDYTELGNTSEFLGVMTMEEMKSMFFVNDSGDTTQPWRLKGHVSDNKFWEWMSSWCVMIQKPSDIGFSDEGYILPPLNYIEHIIPAESNGWFVEKVCGLSDMRASMRDTMAERCKLVADIVNPTDEIFAIWCSLNPEGIMLTKMIDGAIEVAGSTPPELKVKYLKEFGENKIKRLVTKAKIAMYGLNYQNCNNIVVTGMSHSFEAFYQLVRRFHRYGQTKPVNVHIVLGEREESVLDSIKRKEKQMTDMFTAMVRHMSGLTKAELTHSSKKSTPYNPKIEMIIPSFVEAQ